MILHYIIIIDIHCTQSSQMPHFNLKNLRSLHYIYKTENLKEEGILRIPGSREIVEQLKQKIESGSSIDFSKYDVNVRREKKNRNF